MLQGLGVISPMEFITRVSEKQDALFGPLGRWLIQSMKKNISHTDLESMQYQRWMDEMNMSGFRDGSIDEGKAILREVLRILVAYENLTRALVNSGQKYGHGREWSKEPDLPVILDSQKVFAIILGVYQLNRLGLREKAGNLSIMLDASPTAAHWEQCQKRLSIFSICRITYTACLAGQIWSTMTRPARRGSSSSISSYTDISIFDSNKATCGLLTNTDTAWNFWQIVLYFQQPNDEETCR